MWRTSRPVALVVSMFSWSERRLIPQGVHGGQQLVHGSQQTVEPGDNQDIAIAGGGKLRAVCSGAAHGLLKNPLASGAWSASICPSVVCRSVETRA